MTNEETRKDRDDEPPEDHPDEGAGDRDEGGSSSSDAKAPFAPHEDDESALGDTDQHSDA